MHTRQQCPAYGKQCRAFGKSNHFQKVCKSTRKIRPRQRRPVNEVTDICNDYFTCNPQQSAQSFTRNPQRITNEEQIFIIDSVGSNEASEIKEIYSTIQINDHDVKLKVDTGARCNVMPFDLFKQVRRAENSRLAQLVSYSRDSIQTLGETMFKCCSAGKTYNLKFHVIEKAAKPLIGLQDSLNLRLIQVKDIQEIKIVDPSSKTIRPCPTLTKAVIPDEYKDLFDGELGELPIRYKMKLNSEVKPVVRPPRRFPVAYQDKVKQELDYMVTKGVIAPVTEPTQWVSQMMVARRKDSDAIRICIDPKDLNQAIQREHYPMRTVEEVIARMPNAQYFTMLDASHGFWQIPLEHECALNTAFNTPYGRYYFKRLPFGIKSAPEVFQKAMDQMFSGCPCEIIVDDILDWGETEEEHDRNLLKVLDRAREVHL